MSSKYQRSEGYFKGYRNESLFFQSWEKSNPELNIIITHGMGEHSESYSRLIKYFEPNNFSFFAWDLRGHGRSNGKRGYAANFNDFVYDMELFLDEAFKTFKFKAPVILLGHSMGGLIQTKFLLTNQNKFSIKGQVLSSPLFGFSVPVPAIKDKAARWLNTLLPKVTLGNELDNTMLTRDPEVILEFEKDHLRHQVISSGIYLGMIDGFAMVLPRAHEINMPTFMQIAENDPVVSSAKAKEFFESISAPNKRIIVYGDGARHENYNDIHRETVYQDLEKNLRGWLK
ncbi:MAG: lysophospholipase [Bdellovibrionaceae bacterium]|nr:lysophospholipase [Pseudobdellovibrionaceae bacterium]